MPGPYAASANRCRGEACLALRRPKRHAPKKIERPRPRIPGRDGLKYDILRLQSKYLLMEVL
jgi:hypothetical protein